MSPRRLRLTRSSASTRYMVALDQATFGSLCEGHELIEGNRANWQQRYLCVRLFADIDRSDCTGYVWHGRRQAETYACVHTRTGRVTSIRGSTASCLRRWFWPCISARRQALYQCPLRHRTFDQAVCSTFYFREPSATRTTMSRVQLLTTLFGVCLLAQPLIHNGLAAAQDDGGEAFDEKDVVVLTADSFDSMIKKHKYSLVRCVRRLCTMP
jgi:hypothetical protein